ncbi:MAG: hypothetical protein U0K93_00520 [Acutalibacteraceae bacterium]|nr:hypothetical protein [Acutalibacteraceae bacterium]
MKIGKRILSIMMAIITLVSVVSISAEAASVKMAKLSLGYMVPVNSKGTKVLESVNLYGPYDYLNFYIKATKKETTYFFYEIYSDSKMTKCIDGGSVKCKYGEYSFSPEIKLKGKYKTKTYYAVTYAAKVYSSGTVKIDSKSVKEFKIKVDRTDAFKKRIITLNSVTNTANGPKITWDRISGVSKYCVYRRNIDGTKWTKVGSVSSKKSYYTDTSVKNKNGNYIYTVKAVNKKGDATRYHYAGLVCLFAKAPVIDSVSVAGDNEIKIEWGKTKSGAKYTVMRKESGGEWKTLKKSLTTTSYTDKTAKNNKTYQYTVKASFSTDYGTATSSYHSTNGEKIKFFEAPELENVSVVDTGVLVSWNAVEGVSAYKIFRRPLDKSENWTELGTVDSAVLEFTDTTADLESAYIYTVRSEGESKKGSFFKDGIEFVILDAPTKVSHRFNASTDCAVIEWEVVPFATQYNIYIMNESGVWELYDTVEHDSDGSSGYNISCRFVSERTGNIRYAVTALRDGTNETPIKDDVYEMEYFPWVITDSYISVKGMGVNWKDRGAQTYNIYRRTGDSTAEFVLIDTVEGKENGALMEYFDETIEDKTAYTYLVKGVFDGVEQTTCYRESKTYSRLPESEITREEKVYFVRSEFRDEIEVFVAEEDVPIKLYGYDYEKNVWVSLYSGNYNYGPKLSVMNYNLAKRNPDGEYTIAVVYNIDGHQTAFDTNIVTGKFKDAEFGNITAKTTSTGADVTFDAIEGAKKYIITYTDDDTDITKEVVVEESGKKSYTVPFEFDIFDDRDFYIQFTVDAVLSDTNVSRRHGSLDIEKAPDIYKVVRNDDGTVTLYWDDYEPGVSSYRVYRQAEGSTKWRKYNEIYPTRKKINGKKYLYWTDKKAESGVKYKYKVVIHNTTVDSYYWINLDSHYELVTVE